MTKVFQLPPSATSPAKDTAEVIDKVLLLLTI